MSKFNTTNSALTHWTARVALVLLLLNDHYFKWVYSSWWTGKWSDLAGLYLLGLVLSELFPLLRQCCFALSGLLFILWKLPVSEPLVQGLNQLLPWGISRVVDYSDLWCLLILLPAHWFWHKGNYQYLSGQDSGWSYARLIMLPLCVIAFSATSPPLSYRMSAHEYQGDIQIEESYKLKGDTTEVLAYLLAQGFCLQKDTSEKHYAYYDMQRFHLIDTVLYLQRENDKLGLGDSLSSFTFTISPWYAQMSKPATSLRINYLELLHEESFSDWRDLKARQRAARRAFEDMLIEPMRKWLKEN
ncbi:MAG: hypothetical protein AAF433_01300 [Bacteroidota bacterium]